MKSADKDMMKIEDLRLNQVLSNVSDEMYLKDRQHRYVWVNDAQARRLGVRDPEEARGQMAEDFFSEEETRRFVEQEEDIFRTGEPKKILMEYVTHHDNGTTLVSYTKSPVFDAEGNIIGTFGVSRDVSELKQAQDVLRERAKELHCLYQISRISFTGEESLTDLLHQVVNQVPEAYQHPEIARARLKLEDMVITSEHFEESPWKQSSRVHLDGGAAGMLEVFYTEERAGIGSELFLQEEQELLDAVAGVVEALVRTGENRRKLAEYREHLEDLVQERTEEVSRTNKMLEGKIRDAEQAQQTVARQAEEILALSTPVINVWEGILAAVLVGTIDSERARQVTEHLLEKIADTRCRVALLDITGVPTIDTETAQHLIETTTAVRLLGADVFITGMRPAIAQTLVHLGIDMQDFRTFASLREGLKAALRLTADERKQREDGSSLPLE